MADAFVERPKTNTTAELATTSKGESASSDTASASKSAATTATAATAASAATSLLCDSLSILNVDTSSLPYGGCGHSTNVSTTIGTHTDGAEMIREEDQVHAVMSPARNDYRLGNPSFDSGGVDDVGVVNSVSGGSVTSKSTIGSEAKRKLARLFSRSSGLSVLRKDSTPGAGPVERAVARLSVTRGESSAAMKQAKLGAPITEELAEDSVATTAGSPGVAEDDKQVDLVVSQRPDSSRFSRGTEPTILCDRYGFIIGSSYDDTETCSLYSPPGESGVGAYPESENGGMPSTLTFLLKHQEQDSGDKPLSENNLRIRDESPTVIQRRGAKIPDKVRKKRTKVELKREKKWSKMMKKWESLHSEEKKRNKKLLRQRVRKGIPNNIRGMVWVKLADVPTLVATHEGEYEKLVNKAAEAQVLESRDTIERDIGRTFPRHLLFMPEENSSAHSTPGDVSITDRTQNAGSDFPSGLEVFNCVEGAYNKNVLDEELGESDEEVDLREGGGGQARLRRVLNAYGVYDEDVGYCQGMNFITATFLTFIPEEEAFWLLVAVMNEQPCKMRGLFGEGMLQAQQKLHVASNVIRQFLPQLHKHFENENVHITMFATQWLLTVYTSSFPFDLVTRVWDIFIAEGWKIVYRVMLALLQISMPDLMKLGFEDILSFFSKLPSTVDGPAVMETALKIPLKTSHIEKYEKEWIVMNSGTDDNPT